MESTVRGGAVARRADTVRHYMRVDATFKSAHEMILHCNWDCRGFTRVW